MRIGARMREHGIAVRPYPGLRGIGDALRITVAPWAVMERVLEELIAARDVINADANRSVVEASR
jgi:hypothetical protein